MNEVNLPAIEPVTDEDVMVAVNLPARALEPHTRRILEQDRRRVAERQAARQQVGPIERDDYYMRTYIPVAPGWEVQTKGKGSTFRICDHTTKADGDRLAVPDSPYLHDTIERMARAIHAHRLAQETEIERLRAEVLEHKREAARLTDVLLSKHGGEPLQLMDELDDARAEVAALKAACAHRLEALRGANHRIIYGEWASDYSHNLFAAALSTDAGKGWIDASGAVTAVVNRFPAFDAAKIMVQQEVPAEWAGSRVLIVRVP